MSRQKPRVVDLHFIGLFARHVGMPVPKRRYTAARYVRVQLQGSNFLSLAEVKVMSGGTQLATQTGAHYYVNDHLSTPQKLVNQDNQTTWEASYSAFGAVDIATELVTNNHRFPGQYYDAESGLHYNWNRYYDPETGRYITSDPIGLGGGLNTYAYVGGNPLKFVDPYGLYKCSCKGIDSSGGGSGQRYPDGMKKCTYKCSCKCDDGGNEQIVVLGGSWEAEKGSWICHGAITGTNTYGTSTRGFSTFNIDADSWFNFFKGRLADAIDEKMDPLCEDCEK